MAKTFMISDTHFRDKEVFEMSGENKNFKSVADKDAAIISNWNEAVKPEDTVFILGDFGDPNYMTKLNGHKYFIYGNHDKPNMADTKFPIVYKNFFILSHEPMFITEDGPYANIFGHVHNNPIYRTVSSRSYCVCACRNNYTPVEFSKIVEAMKNYESSNV